MDTMTLAEASRELQVSRKSLARRAERGTIRTLLDPSTGRRKIPIAELERVFGWQPDSPSEPRSGPLEGKGNPATPLDIAPLLKRLEELAAENGKLRLLSERAESLEGSEREVRIQLEAELLAAKQRIAELENKSSWWRRKKQS